MKITRILPKEEYSKLIGTELELVWKDLPAESKILVVEEYEKIIGTWAVIPYTHVECVWVHPDYRGKGTVLKKLVPAMFKLLRKLNISHVLTSALSEEVELILRNKFHAQELPGKHFVFGVVGEDK